MADVIDLKEQPLKIKNALGNLTSKLLKNENFYWNGLIPMWIHSLYLSDFFSLLHSVLVNHLMNFVQILLVDRAKRDWELCLNCAKDYGVLGRYDKDIFKTMKISNHEAEQYCCICLYNSKGNESKANHGTREQCFVPFSNIWNIWKKSAFFATWYEMTNKLRIKRLLCFSCRRHGTLKNWKFFSYLSFDILI